MKTGKIRFTALLLSFIMLFSLAACKSSQAESQTKSQPDTTSQKQDETEKQEEPEQTQNDTAQSKSLVVYFSATGTTKGVAEKIASLTGADTYEIKAAKEYTSADLDWNDSNSRSTTEQNDSSARPEIGSEKISLDGYDTIYIGYPIWWGEEPRIMDTFVESCNFDGKTMIPFCTSGGSGIGRSGKNLESMSKSGTWLEGKRFGGSVSESEIQNWIDGLK